MGNLIQLHDIPEGTQLSDGLFDGSGALLLPRGSIVSSSQLKSFALKGLRYFQLGNDCEFDDEPSPCDDERPYAAATESPSLRAEATVALRSQSIPSPSESVSEWNASKVKQDVTSFYLADVERVTQIVQRAAATVESLGRSFADGTLKDAIAVYETADVFLQEIREHSSQLIATTLRQEREQRLAVRSVQMSVLSIAIANAMKLNGEEQSKVGVAAMLHDVALFQLPDSCLQMRLNLNPETLRVYESHPILAYDALESVRNIDQTVRMLIVQAHEQADGSGFPRQLTLARTHKLSRILNLADAYLTLVSCGESGQCFVPADAIAYLMHHSCAGRFDTVATCGLVRAISLYPLGSLVQLSNDQIASVVRVSDNRPTKPMVSTMDENGDTLIIDLAVTDVCVVKPATDHQLGQRRIASGDLDKILW